jgi:hypothetical protein
MTALRALAGDLNRAVAILLSGVALGLAAAVALTSHPVPTISQAVFGVVGWVFPGLFVALMVLGLVSILRLWRGIESAVWRQTGLQAASCIATLALTCTLLGISLGIGALAETPLTPETVTEVISTLTERFSMAFMTTVIGLPVSALMRSAVMILAARGDIREDGS